MYVNQVLAALSAVNAPVVANSIVETSMFPAGGNPTFPAGSLGEGSTLKLTTFGKFSNRAAAPGTITLQAKLGGNLVWSSGALALPAAVHTDITFWLDILLMLRAGGVQSKVMGAGLLQVVLGTQTDFLLPATSPTDSAAFDTTSADLDLDLTAKFSVADVGNKIQALGFQLAC
jgi:hypothetical protein